MSILFIVGLCILFVTLGFLLLFYAALSDEVYDLDADMNRFKDQWNSIEKDLIKYTATQKKYVDNVAEGIEGLKKEITEGYSDLPERVTKTEEQIVDVGSQLVKLTQTIDAQSKEIKQLQLVIKNFYKALRNPDTIDELKEYKDLTKKKPKK